MGDYIAVRSSEIEEAISTFNTHQANLEDIMQAIKSQINNMTAWQGDAHERFVSDMQQWDQQMVNAHGVLGEVSAELKSFLARVQELEGRR